VGEGGVTWRCALCETENPIEASQCRACGASFADTVRPPAPERVRRDPNTAAMVSLFFPGAGHAYIGLWGQAVARAVTTVWVVVVVLVAALQGGLAGAGTIPILFSLVAFGLWIVAAHDAYREARVEPHLVILKPRYFLYLVMGLLLLLFIAVVASGLRATT
jgi:ribosomal protein L40E